MLRFMGYVGGIVTSVKSEDHAKECDDGNDEDEPCLESTPECTCPTPVGGGDAGPHGEPTSPSASIATDAGASAMQESAALMAAEMTEVTTPEDCTEASKRKRNEDDNGEGEPALKTRVHRLRRVSWAPGCISPEPSIQRLHKVARKASDDAVQAKKQKQANAAVAAQMQGCATAMSPARGTWFQSRPMPAWKAQEARRQQQQQQALHPQQPEQNPTETHLHQTPHQRQQKQQQPAVKVKISQKQAQQPRQHGQTLQGQMPPEQMKQHPQQMHQQHPQQKHQHQQQSARMTRARSAAQNQTYLLHQNAVLPASTANRRSSMIMQPCIQGWPR
jgi:hypothetical protein